MVPGQIPRLAQAVCSPNSTMPLNGIWCDSIRYFELIQSANRFGSYRDGWDRRLCGVLAV